MSRSSLIKLILITAISLAPKFAAAKTLQFQEQTWTVNPLAGKVVEKLPIRNDLDLRLLATQTILGSGNLPSANMFDEETAKQLATISASINHPAVNAKLVIENKIAIEFEPGSAGQSLDMSNLRQLLNSNQEVITLPMVYTAPTNKLSDTNTLGINELVAVGESDFTGSPNNRIHNINVGATKFQGLIIDQGEEFSFNKYLGDVDDVHGFLPELVIKATGTVPEFGGGLCQVSSTAFRAAMNAGLPITARRNHSYAVQYYAPQGTDATIYPGVQDLKFRNDLTSPILVRTKIVDKKLYFEYYGTKDTRTVTFEGPMQYDRKPDGSMKATWTRHVTMNGATTDQTFNSIYQPPALFHKEEQKSTPNPQTEPTINNQPVTIN